MQLISPLGTEECSCAPCPLHGDSASAAAALREEREQAPDLLLILGDEGYFEEEPEVAPDAWPLIGPEPISAEDAQWAIDMAFENVEAS